MEHTFIIVKPDGMKKKIVGEIVSRFEKKGLELIASKVILVPAETARRHYDVHSRKPFFEGLVNFISSGPVALMVWRGENATQVGRYLCGDTDPMKAQLGTIRGDYAINITQNIIHSSENPTDAEREIAIFFTGEEIRQMNLLQPAALHSAPPALAAAPQGEPKGSATFNRVPV